MNADVGGNCELTEPGEVFVTENGVTIVGTTNLPGELSTTASMLYSNNMVTFLSTLVSQESISIDLDDSILVGAPEETSSTFREWVEFYCATKVRFTTNRVDFEVVN